MDRYWLLTWTTYGTWLPGDDRGFVSNVRDGEGPEVRHNSPGTEPDAKQRGLWLSAKSNMKGPAVYLSAEQAAAVLEQLQETSRYRGWELLAVYLTPARRTKAIEAVRSIAATSADWSLR